MKVLVIECAADAGHSLIVEGAGTNDKGMQVVDFEVRAGPANIVSLDRAAAMEVIRYLGAWVHGVEP